MALYVNTTFTNISTVSSNIPLLNVSLLNISDQKSNNVSVNDITVNNYDVDTTLQVLSLDVKNDAIIGGDLTAPNFDLSLSSLTVQSLNVTTSIDCTGTSVFDNLTVTNDLIVTGDLDLTTAEVNDIDVSSVFYCTLMELTSDISSATTNATNLDCSNNINTDLAVGGDVEVVASVTTTLLDLETTPILEYTSLPTLTSNQLGYLQSITSSSVSRTFTNTAYNSNVALVFQSVSDALTITVAGTYLLTAQVYLKPITTSYIGSYGISIATTNSATATVLPFSKKIFSNYQSTNNKPMQFGINARPALSTYETVVLTNLQVPQSYYIALTINPENAGYNVQQSGFTLNISSLKIA